MNRRDLIASAMALAVAGAFPSCAARAVSFPNKPEFDSPEFWHELKEAMRDDMIEKSVKATTKFLESYEDIADRWTIWNYAWNKETETEQRYMHVFIRGINHPTLKKVTAIAFASNADDIEIWPARVRKFPEFP